jgi:hypothetical protein
MVSPIEGEENREGININALNSLLLQGVKRRSNPKKNEIATPFGLAMTCKDNKYIKYICIRLTKEIPFHNL